MPGAGNNLRLQAAQLDGFRPQRLGYGVLRCQIFLLVVRVAFSVLHAQNAFAIGNRRVAGENRRVLRQHAHLLIPARAQRMVVVAVRQDNLHRQAGGGAKRRPGIFQPVAGVHQQRRPFPDQQRAVNPDLVAKMQHARQHFLGFHSPFSLFSRLNACILGYRPINITIFVRLSSHLHFFMRLCYNPAKTGEQGGMHHGGAC